MSYVIKELHNKKVKIDLIGVGGTGSLVLSGLVRLNYAIRKLGHPFGLTVKVWDPDIVTDANLGRQLFTFDEVGMNKAEALVNRYNLGFGLDWEAKAQKYNPGYNFADIVISCVDTKEARREIFEDVKRNPRKETYLIDSGNDGHFGQVILGKGTEDLPYPYDIRPDLIKGKDEKKAPSCSLAEALSYQDLFINQWMATAVLELIWKMFRKGALTYKGFYINLDNGRMNPINIESKTA